MRRITRFCSRFLLFYGCSPLTWSHFFSITISGKKKIYKETQTGNWEWESKISKIKWQKKRVQLSKWKKNWVQNSVKRKTWNVENKWNKRNKERKIRKQNFNSIRYSQSLFSLLLFLFAFYPSLFNIEHPASIAPLALGTEHGYTLYIW